MVYLRALIMVGSGFPVSVPIVGILPMVAGFGLLSWISSPLNILGSARRIVSGSPLSWGLGFDIASNLHGTDEGNSHHDKEGYCLFLYLFLSSVVWPGKNVYVFFQKYNHVFKADDNQWFTYSCYLHAYCLDLLSENPYICLWSILFLLWNG